MFHFDHDEFFKRITLKRANSGKSTGIGDKKLSGIRNNEIRANQIRDQLAKKKLEIESLDREIREIMKYEGNHQSFVRETGFQGHSSINRGEMTGQSLGTEKNFKENNHWGQRNSEE